MLRLHHHPHLPIRADWHDGVLQGRAAGCASPTPAATRATRRAGDPAAQVRRNAVHMSMATCSAASCTGSHATQVTMLQASTAQNQHNVDGVSVPAFAPTCVPEFTHVWVLPGLCCLSHELTAGTTTVMCTRLLSCFHSMPVMPCSPP